MNQRNLYPYFPTYQPPPKPEPKITQAAAADLLDVCKAAVADAAKAVNPAARLPNYKQMAAAIAKAESTRT